MIFDHPVLPAALHESIFLELHGSLTSYHFGVEETVGLLMARYKVLHHDPLKPLELGFLIV